MISCSCGCIAQLGRRGLIASALAVAFPSWAQNATPMPAISR